jgi:fluoride exporter
VIIALAIGVAAAVGALSRYGVDVAISRRIRTDFPWGTFVVNMSGSLLLGVVLGLGLHHGLASTPVLVAGTGFAGGYTTLSTWSYETVELAEEGRLLGATLNVFASFVIGILAAAAGLGLALL